MNYQIIMCLIVVVFTVLSMLAVPWLKKKGLWTATLFAVNIIEQICSFLELQGYGPKKYKFVRKVLLMLNSALTDEEINTLIETMVTKMHELGVK